MTGRSIPACAGEPRPVHRLPDAAAVYPHVCGGTAPSRTKFKDTSGLSPRVRGNLGTVVATHLSPRSIPACAGEPVLRIRRNAFQPVYPRVCGGTTSASVSESSGKGLSPRVRGNPDDSNDARSYARSIPACAGEPGCLGRNTMSKRVYPRVCGGTC